jgi:hypothetical protein
MNLVSKYGHVVILLGKKEFGRTLFSQLELDVEKEFHRNEGMCRKA